MVVGMLKFFIQASHTLTFPVEAAAFRKKL